MYVCPGLSLFLVSIHLGTCVCVCVCVRFFFCGGLCVGAIGFGACARGRASRFRCARHAPKRVNEHTNKRTRRRQHTHGLHKAHARAHARTPTREIARTTEQRVLTMPDGSELDMPHIRLPLRIGKKTRGKKTEDGGD